MSDSPSHVARNDAERARLRALVDRLGDDELRRPIGHDWTVAAALAHLAHWDRRGVAVIEDWERDGTQPAAVDADAINDAELPHWLAMPPREAAREAVAAAEAIDRKVAALAPALAEAILAVRARTLDRSMHRRGHLAEIERALA